MPSLRKIIIAALCLPTIALADDAPLHWYHVEMIVFSQLQADSLSSEVWPAVSDPEIPDNAIALSTDNPNLPDNFKLLSKSDWQLKKQDYALRRNPDYTVLWHMAWQEGFDRYHKTAPLYIDAANINGLISLTMRRYFELKTDFIYRLPKDDLAQIVDLDKYNGHNINGNIASFEVMQSRRFRSKEMNYLDHPILGMIVDIEPMANIT